MNRHAQELLAKINAKKEEIKTFAAAGDVAGTKKAKKELDDLQAMFEAVKDLDDEGAAAAGAAAAAGGAQVIDGAGKQTIGQKIRAFVGVLTARINHEEADAEHVRIVNQMNEADPGTDGGLTVPQDIRTQIEELRRTEDDLEQYVNVERVSTLSGSRVIELEADATPWDTVDEAKQFPEADTPKMKQIEYKIKKFGGILKLTYELLQDTAENIMGYLKKYIAKKTRATRNAAIIKKVKEIAAAAEEVEVTGIDELKDIFNEQLDPALRTTAKIITNQSGFNYLDKLKDSDGNYILQPDPTKPTQKLLFGAYPVVTLLNKTLQTVEVTTGSGETAKVTGYKYPIICGDLKEAITLFDREYMSIEISNTAGDLWESDLTGVKVRDRFDVQAVDTGAVIMGSIVEAVNG